MGSNSVLFVTKANKNWFCKAVLLLFSEHEDTLHKGFHSWAGTQNLPSLIVDLSATLWFRS